MLGAPDDPLVTIGEEEQALLMSSWARWRDRFFQMTALHAISRLVHEVDA